jgi:AcrR family transcriptional regulator
MTRPSNITRERILKAAERLFADRGYEETSIRAIVTKARVNQAAINYHFGGKDGLYREVLRTAFRGLTKQQLAHAQEMQGMSRENALSEFIRHQLHPLGERGELSRHLRIFNWEAVRPTAVYRKLMSEEAAPFMALRRMGKYGPAAAGSGLRPARMERDQHAFPNRRNAVRNLDAPCVLQVGIDANDTKGRRDLAVENRRLRVWQKR